jgi:hypothetical protein
MREIRPYGSVRGVRRKPYPYRDMPHPMRSMVPVAATISMEDEDASAAALARRRIVRRPL